MLFDGKGKTPEGEAATPGEDKGLTHHRNKLAGMWAAELLGLIGQAAHDYAREVAHAHENLPDGAHADDEHVVRRLSRDLHGKAGVHEIRTKLAHFLQEAKRHIAEHRHKQ